MHRLVGLLAAAVLSAGQGRQTFVGVITDSECDRADHSRMRMGPTDAECAVACLYGHGATCHYNVTTVTGSTHNICSL